jgi:hypothetical protein
MTRIARAFGAFFCFTVWVFVSGICTGSVRAQSSPYDLRANYDKAEYQVTMRDSVKLFVSVYSPKDKSKKYPILLQRTPYSVGPYGSDAYRSVRGSTEQFARDGYILAFEDVRGQNKSEGKWSEIRPHNPKKAGSADIDESTDTYDTVDWLVKNIANNNGRVGMIGISYPGFYVSSGIVDTHPAIKAASPQAPVSDWFHGDDDHHNGALWLPHSFLFYSGFGRPGKPPLNFGTNDGYQFFLDMGSISNADTQWLKGDVEWWTDMLKHPNFDDFWKDRTILYHLKNIKAATMTVGGWFDAEDLYGALATYRNIETKNPRIPRNMIVMGPWSHGQWSNGPGDRLGDGRFGAATGEFYRKNIELPFFNYYLKDSGTMDLPEAYVFETGSNKWRQFAAWPPKEAKERRLYLLPGGKIGFEAPGNGAGAEFTEYVSDPAKPVASTALARKQLGMPRDYMAEDQRFSASDPSVITFVSEPLREDFTIAGPISSALYASTSGTDSDFIVKLIDVYPDDTPNALDDRDTFKRGGMQFMVRGEPMPARFRKSFEKPVAMTPNKPEKIEFVMPDALHTFGKGHRIMVHIQSSWFPMVARNPQTFVPNTTFATPDQFVKATERIYHTPKMPSSIKVGEIKPAN